MDHYKKWTILLCFVFAIDFINCGVTIEQMEKSMAMVRGVCLPKSKITEEMANGIIEGKLPDEKPLKCYIHCCLELTGMMKKNKINYEATLKQIDLLMPDDIKAPYKNALAICKEAAVGIKDPCDAGYALLKCMKNEYKDMLFA